MSKCLWGREVLAEIKLGGSGSRKTGLMVALILGAAEHFFWGLKISRSSFFKGQVNSGLLYSLGQDARFQELPFSRKCEVPSVNLPCTGYSLGMT